MVLSARRTALVATVLLVCLAIGCGRAVGLSSDPAPPRLNVRSALAGVSTPPVSTPQLPSAPSVHTPSVPSVQAPSVPHVPSAPQLPSTPSAPSVAGVSPSVPQVGAQSGSSSGAGAAGSSSSGSGSGSSGSSTDSSQSSAGAGGSNDGGGAAVAAAAAHRRQQQASQRRLERTVKRDQGCLAQLPTLQRRVLDLRAGIGGPARSPAATARALHIDAGRESAAERGGLHTLREQSASGACGPYAVAPSPAAVTRLIDQLPSMPRLEPPPVLLASAAPALARPQLVAVAGAGPYPHAAFEGAYASSAGSLGPEIERPGSNAPQAPVVRASLSSSPVAGSSGASPLWLLLLLALLVVAAAVIVAGRRRSSGEGPALAGAAAGAAAARGGGRPELRPWGVRQTAAPAAAAEAPAAAIERPPHERAEAEPAAEPAAAEGTAAPAPEPPAATGGAEAAAPAPAGDGSAAGSTYDAAAAPAPANGRTRRRRPRASAAAVATGLASVIVRELLKGRRRR